MAEEPISRSWDDVVLGAGVIGLWTATQLARQGRKVLVLEQFMFPHSRGSSHGQTRIFRHSYEDPVETELTKASLPHWQWLEREVQDALLQSLPMLNLADEPVIASTIDRMEQNLVAHGIPHQRLSHQELREKFPELNYPSTYEGLLEYGAGVLFADKCLAALKTTFVRLGGTIQDGTKVVKVTPMMMSADGRGIIISVATKHTVTGMERAERCTGFAACPGPWARDILLGSIVPIPFEVPSMKVFCLPVPYYSIKDGQQFPKVSFCDYFEGGHTWGISDVEYPGLVKVGPASMERVEVSPERRDEPTVDHLIDWLEGYLRNAMPTLQPRPSISERCMITCPPDMKMVLDRHPDFNIAVACGMSGTGFKMAPAIGSILADWIQGRKSEFDVRHFSAKRFQQLSA